MMYRTLMAAMVMGLLLFDYAAASDQLYRYKDANGNWYYTDNLADVPANQRESCKTYEAIAPPAEQSTDASQATKSNPGAAASGEEAQHLRAQLEQRKTDLDQEYEALVEESAALEKLSLNLNTERKKQDFEERKDKFNQRVKAFEGKRKTFTEDLQAYNNVTGR